MTKASWEPLKKTNIAAALSTRATQALLRGDLARLRSSAAEAHAFFEERGDAWGQLQTSYPLAALAAITGDHAHAAHLHEHGLRLAQELEFWTDAADRLTGLDRVALLTGDFPRAAELHRKAMALAADHGYAAGEIHAEIGLALGARRAGDFGPGPALLLAEQRGDAPAAVSLHDQGLAVARESGGALAAGGRDRITARVPAALGCEVFAAEFSACADSAGEPGRGGLTHR